MLARLLVCQHITLAGVVLPHDHFGSYLDDSGNTIDTDLERKIFEKAGEILCDIWNNISIDNHTEMFLPKANR